MSGLFSSPNIPAPIVPGPAPQVSDQTVIADANAERQRLATASGRASTFLTPTNTTAGPSGARTLLGVN